MELSRDRNPLFTRDMVRVKIIGSASGVPTKKRFNESVHVEFDAGSLLFDCGEPCSARLIREDIDYNDIGSVFVSHLHCDHVAGLPQLIQTMQLTSREKPLNLFLPSEGIERLKKYFEMLYLVEDILPFTMNIEAVREGAFFEDPGVRVSAFANKHLDSLLSKFGKKFPENLGESYSFLIETEEARIAYSGDIAAVEELDRFTDNLDLLILELAHIEPEEVFRHVKARKLVLTHIHSDLDDKEEEIMEIGKKYAGDVVVACDGTEVIL